MHKLLVRAIVVIPSSPGGIYGGRVQAVTEELSVLRALPVGFLLRPLPWLLRTLPSAKAALLIPSSEADKAQRVMKCPGICQK